MSFVVQKVMVAIAAIALFIIALSACGSDDFGERKPTSRGLVEQVLVLDDGREITCIRYSGGYAGGLSCDW